MDGLEAYRVPDTVRIGVEIVLPKAPGAKFRVRLPSRHNVAYQRECMAQQMRCANITGPGIVDWAKVDLVGMREARLAAFCTHCLVLPLPGGMTVDDFRTEYPMALDDLFTEAERLATLLDAEGEDAAKKSQRSPRGKSGG